ncbi:DUF2207 domain-containing protein [Devosia sp. J2-20]|uniref:DUF2207 domain-containing protein n=1 Tax=Devosia sp. J2-20 TaxID=3026161 RepID=UPI00249C1F77|nr:DUF2207 domain-containing protein [Devosia sp. J2-20]WDQ97630.1 DUF2207 domain-containing protein [Devosia sp. J2-20]
MPALFRSIIALLIGLLLAVPGVAREEIRAYASDITMAVDGTVTVTETLTVNAEGDEIRRGIYRDIPVVLAGSDGGKVRPDFDVLNVQRDGQPETYRVERMGDFQRIWIGDPDVFLNYGNHSYTITYSMSRMARAFEDHDELYWNVTGNYWVFPILSAQAVVRLPDGARISDVSAYTGPVGSTKQGADIRRLTDQTVAFKTTRALGPGEGLTVAVSFDKGVIVYPTGVAALSQQVADLRDSIIPVIAALLAAAYNALAWFRVGRDPQKGVIIPRFHAPAGFSPALVHYIHKWGFSDSGWTALTAAIFNLGVKGLITIDNSTKNLRLARTGKQPAETLPPGEEVVFEYLQSRDAVVINKSTGPELAKRRNAFTTAITQENRLVWFKNNTGYSVLGYLLGIGLLAGMVFLDILDPLWLIGSVALGILLSSLGGLISKGFQKRYLSRVFIAIWVLIAGVNIVGLAFDSLTSLTINVASVSAVSIVIVTIVFAFLMRAPTLQGRKVMDEIDGLKMYLETAEKDRMNMSDVPPMTVERFERLLPFAIALQVEKPWSEHFEAELARHAVVDAPDHYAPGWYSGGNVGRARSAASNMTTAVSAAASSMTAAMVAAQPVQSSSSGSSGGGFSGGGGGGGGGGGW